MCEKSNILLVTKIDVIKLIRTISTLGLHECKILAELWGDTFGYGGSTFNVDDFSIVMVLLKMVGKINRGEWVLQEGRITYTRTVDKTDILNLQ